MLGNETDLKSNFLKGRSIFFPHSLFHVEVQHVLIKLPPEKLDPSKKRNKRATHFRFVPPPNLCCFLSSWNPVLCLVTPVQMTSGTQFITRQRSPPAWITSFIKDRKGVSSFISDQIFLSFYTQHSGLVSFASSAARLQQQQTNTFFFTLLWLLYKILNCFPGVRLITAPSFLKARPRT